jgi:uncharacterized protein YkwD
MYKKILHSIIALSLLVSSSLALPRQAIAQDSLIPELFVITNQVRVDRGVATLTLSQELSLAAQEKLADMQVHQYWDHARPGDGTMAWGFIEEQAYRYATAGENLGRGYSRADALVDAWEKSPRHAENLFDPIFTDVGFAVGPVQTERGMEMVVVQLFASRQ